MRSNNCWVRMAVLYALACAPGLILATPGTASADPARFDIAAQPLPTALKNFAAQAKMQLLYRYDIVSHKTASPVTGQLEKHAALDLLLRGTGLEAVYSNDNTATIRLISAEEKTPSGTKGGADDATERTGGELELLLKQRTGFNQGGYVARGDGRLSHALGVSARSSRSYSCTRDTRCVAN